MKDAARKGLRLRRQFGRGGLDTRQAHAQGVGSGVQRASNIVHSDKLPLETWKRIKAYFDRHQRDREAKGSPSRGFWGDDSNPSAGYVAWLLWGGDDGYRKAKEIAAMAKKNPSKLSEQFASWKAKSEPAAVRELELYADNEWALYNQKKSILKNLVNKKAAGKYDPLQAAKLWGYWYDEAARRYTKEFGGGSGFGIFTKADRMTAAAEAEKYARQEIEGGEHDDLLHKKYRNPTQRKSPFPELEKISWFKPSGRKVIAAFPGSYDYYAVDAMAPRGSNERTDKLGYYEGFFEAAPGEWSMTRRGMPVTAIAIVLGPPEEDALEIWQKDDEGWLQKGGTEPGFGVSYGWKRNPHCFERNPGHTAREPQRVMEAYWSKVPEGEEVDARGLARATGVQPLTAERFLDGLHQAGQATKDGKWYGPVLRSNPRYGRRGRYGSRASRQAAQQAWMAKVASLVRSTQRFDFWDTAKFFYDQGLTPEQAAAKLDRVKNPRRPRIDLRFGENRGKYELVLYGKAVGPFQKTSLVEKGEKAPGVSSTITHLPTTLVFYGGLTPKEANTVFEGLKRYYNSLSPAEKELLNEGGYPPRVQAMEAMKEAYREASGYQIPSRRARWAKKVPVSNPAYSMFDDLPQYAFDEEIATDRYFLQSEKGRTASFHSLTEAKDWADQFLSRSEYFTVTSPSGRVMEYEKG